MSIAERANSTLVAAKAVRIRRHDWLTRVHLSRRRLDILVSSFGIESVPVSRARRTGRASGDGTTLDGGNGSGRRSGGRRRGDGGRSIVG